jgi:hypothetical protein
VTPAEYAQALAEYNAGPDPKDPDAPLTPEEQALVDAQGDRIDRDRNP